MGVDGLFVFGVAAVDVTRDVQVVAVLDLDFFHRDKARVLGVVFDAVHEGLHNLVNVAFAQAVLGAVFHKVVACVNHEDAAAHPLAFGSVFLVHHDDAGGNARAVEKVRGEPDNALDVAAIDDILAEGFFGVATEKHAVGQNHCRLAGGLERLENVQKPSVVTVFFGRAIVIAVEAAKFLQAIGPVLERERRIRDHKVETFQCAVVQVLRVRERVARLDFATCLVMENQVHFCKARRRGFFFLTVNGDVEGSLVGCANEERARTARRVVNGRVSVLDFPQADDFRQDAAHFCRSVELPLALAAFGGEVAHQVFVGIAQNVVAARLIVAKVEFRAFKDRHEAGQGIHHVLAVTELGIVKELCVVDDACQVVRFGEFRDGLVHLFANVLVVLERDEVIKTTACRDVDIGVLLTLELVGHVLHKKERQNVVLVLASVHAAAQFVTRFPERRVKFVLLDSHIKTLGREGVSLFYKYT